MGEYDLIKYDDNNPFEIIIYDHIYHLPRIFLAEAYHSYQLIDAISDITYKDKFLRWIVDNGVSEDGFVLSAEILSNADDQIFQKYIEAFINENDFLKEKYNKHSSLDIYEKFWCIIELSLAANLSTSLVELGNTAKELRRQFIDDSLLSISQMGKVMLSGIKEALSGFNYSVFLKNITDNLI